MRIILLFFLAIQCCITSYAQAPTDTRLEGLDTFVNRVLEDWKAPGISIAVVEKGKVIYTGGFGFRNVEEKLPVTQHTLFAIGSCTKAFTASMIGMLEKEGKLDLDKPVRNYLPELKFKNEYTNAHCTLRDMMCHRTGLPRHDYSWYGSTASRHQLLERIQYLEPSAELREKYQYNNFMFMSLGVVIEKITGKSWEQNLEERILKPLKMDDTNMSIAALEEAKDRSLAYQSTEDEIKVIPYRNIDAIGPAGSINSSAADMSNWLLTWINNGLFEDEEIIPSGYRNQAITMQMASGGGLPGEENPDIHLFGYGLAWGVSSYGGHYRVEHSGGIDGFISTTSFFPSDSLGIFVVSNQGGPSNSVRNFIADRMLGIADRNWRGVLLKQKNQFESNFKTSPNQDSLNQIKNTTPSHPDSSYTGSYENKGYGIAKIFLENDTLWIDYNEAGKRTKSYLQHYHYDVFRTRSTVEKTDNKNATKLNFQTDEKGNVSAFKIKIEPAVDELVFVRQATVLDIDPNDLEKYLGNYNLMGNTVKVYLRGDGTLMVLVPGQPDYELVPIGTDQFKIKVAEGYEVHFEVNDEHKVLSLSFVQPNGTFKAVKQ
ncbi:MAG: serine hydrolase [Saprospiraceae bacterium]|nr:serine hydrolase [Saprospiraceae bacterium]